MIKILPIIVFFSFIINGFANELSEPLPKVTRGKIVRHVLFPSNYVAPRNVDVWLPDDYNPENKYKVLYMHDGQMLYDAKVTWNKQEWGVDETISRLIDNDSISPTIVIGIWNSGRTRHSDYFPQKPFENLPISTQDSLILLGRRQNNVSLFAERVQSDNYLRFIVEEL